MTGPLTGPEPRDPNDQDGDGRADIPPDVTVAFSPRQVGGFVVIATILVALVRWLRGRNRS